MPCPFPDKRFRSVEDFQCFLQKLKGPNKKSFTKFYKSQESYYGRGKKAWEDESWHEAMLSTFNGSGFERGIYALLRPEEKEILQTFLR